jgi:acetyl-CoA carboxylase biotin carboxylase subunit
VQTYHPPGGPGVRVDSALYAGAIVPPFYDSLIAKLVVHDHDRAAALARAKRALGEYVIAGLPTNLPLLQAVLAQEAFASGAYHTGWLTGFLVDWQARD